MSRKIYGALLPVLAIAAFALAPAVAQAAPKWEICKHESTATHKFSDSECQKEVANTGNWEWVVIPNGTANKVRVVTFTPATLALKLASGAEVKCFVIDAGKIWNEASGGFDEITAFTNYECESVPATACPTPTITAEKLPWKTKLATGPIDEIEGIQVQLFCSGVASGTFTGTLKPKVVNSTETHPLFTEFTSATGDLENAAKEKAEVLGDDNILTLAGEDVKA
jgi:hypothetical protein